MDNELVDDLFGAFITMARQDGVLETLTPEVKYKILQALDVEVEQSSTKSTKVTFMGLIVSVDFTDEDKSDIKMSMDITKLASYFRE